MGTMDDALAALDDAPETMADRQATPSFKAPGTLDDALSVLEATEQTDQLKGVSQLGLKKNPASSTKVLQLFGKTGLPKDFIERNQEFVEREAAKGDFHPDQLMKDSPAFASWLAEHPDHVAAAKPDLSKLSYLERQVRRIKDAIETGPLLVELGDLGNKSFQETMTPQDRARQAEIEKRLESLGRSDQENDITGFFEGIPAAAVEQAPLFLRSLGGKVEYGAKGLVAGTVLGGVTGSVAGPPGSAAGATGAGIVMGLAGWRYGAAIEAGKLELGHALLDYEKLKDEQGNPLDRTTIKGLSLMAGAINGALEGLTGVEALANKLPGVRNIVRGGVKDLLKTPTARAALLRMGKDVGDTMLTEGATEALQMYVTKAGGELAKWAADGGSAIDVLGRIFSRENFEQAKQEAIKGAQGAGGTSIVLTAPSLVQDVKQVRQASKNQRAFEAMGKAAESSQFVKDLPDQLQEIIKRATEKGPVEQLYVPTESFTQYFQSQGADPRQVYQEVTGDVEAYDQAVLTGHPLPIKTADYAAKLAGTEHNAFFSQELKTNIDQMNAREAAEWMTLMDEQDQAEAQQPGVQASSITDSASKVRQDILGQLQAIGFDLTVADQYAALMAERYTARAQRRGLGEDPAALFQRLNLQISAQLPTILQTLGKQTSELDALLNRLRVGDVPKPAEVFGQSLTEFLKDKGGLQDQGGELSSRNVDDTRQPFQKNLIQKEGKTLDEAAELAAEAGYLDERDIGALIDALDKESRGTPVYAVGRENSRLLDIKTNLDSLREWLLSRSIDLNQSSNEQVKALLGEAVQQPLPMTDGETFAQSDVEKKKGSITFGSDAVSIKLLEQADKSTFIHEVGHLWLNELIDDATTEGTPQQLKDDLDTLLKWLRVDVTSASGRDAIKAAIQTQQHEQFARGFEAYAMEGRAPSFSLREIFATFRQWLIQVYRSLITAPLNVRLTKDVRAVMDRMIATDEAIEQAALSADVTPSFLTAESAGMSKTQWDAYQDLVRQASLTARETLQAKLMRQYQREQEAWWTQKREEMLSNVTAEVNAQPEYTALAVLKTGKMPDGSDLPDGIAPMKLNKKGLTDAFGKDFVKAMPKGLTAKDGMHHDAVAQLFGYTNGQDFVLALVNARPKEELIEAETDRRMREAYGDIRFDAGRGSDRRCPQ